MATVLGVLSAHIVDSYGIPGQSSVFVSIDDAQTLATIAADVEEYVDQVDPLTGGIITEATLKLTFPGDGLAPSAAVGDIEKGALFNFSNATDSYLQGQLIPDVKASILNASGLIDLTNANVLTWITWMTTAHTAITVVTKGVRALSALVDALITFRKHRKPLSRKTKEL